MAQLALVPADLVADRLSRLRWARLATFRVALELGRKPTDRCSITDLSTCCELRPRIPAASPAITPRRCRERSIGGIAFPPVFAARPAGFADRSPRRSDCAA